MSCLQLYLCHFLTEHRKTHFILIVEEKCGNHIHVTVFYCQQRKVQDLYLRIPNASLFAFKLLFYNRQHVFQVNLIVHNYTILPLNFKLCL